MRLRIDSDACTGHGRCYVLAPALVDCDDEGYGSVAKADLDPADEELARKAVLGCPERAVHVDD
jgi:ferredoxin